ncbi:MAG: protein phosphatase 2C domain-containing protein [Eubacterium sp.]
MDEESKNLWNCYMKKKTGKRHQIRKMLCQDRVAYKQSGNRQSIALVDGVGDNDINILAGEKIADAINDFLLNEFDEIMKEKEENVTYTLLIKMQRIIEKLMSEYNFPKEQFSSTILGVCIDLEKELYCAVHLGDGIILFRNKEIKILSYPTNGLFSNQTVLSTSETAINNIKLYRGELENTREIILISDGVYNFPLYKNQWNEFIKRTKCSKEEFAGKEDDQSVILLSREDA